MLQYHFTVDQLKNETIDILSVFSDKLLIGSNELTMLFIYSHKGRHLLTITIDYMPLDATWTPLGKIVYSVLFRNEVLRISEFGEIISTFTQTTEPHFFSVSNDTIYLADSATGVYQSKDDGVNWHVVFKSTEEWQCLQVIKVTYSDNDEFWTLERTKRYNFNLVYRVNGNMDDRKRKLTGDINVITKDGKRINLTDDSRLSYDGNVEVFLSDRTQKNVHVLSANGKYHCQLLLPNYIENYPRRLAVDSKQQVLFVGQDKGVVGFSKLTHCTSGI